MMDEADSRNESHDRHLSAGKEYHAFISYITADASFVKKLIRHLEENLKFQCMFAEQHFTPGEPVIDNMSNAYPKCEKVLFLVSKDFLESGFCETEVVLAYTYAMENRRKNYILVLKIDDSQVHSKLRVCTYIDGVDRDIDVIGNRFEMAYSGIVKVEDDNRNGTTILRKCRVEESRSLCGGMNYVFQDLSENEMEQLRASHIEASATCYKDIQMEINKTGLLKHFAMITASTKKAKCMMSVIFLGCLTFLCSILAFLYWLKVKPTWALWVIGTPVALFISGCSYFGMDLWIQNIRKRVFSGLPSIAISKMNLKSNKYIILSRRTESYVNRRNLHLVFIYYDVAPCWKYFKEHVEWSDTSEEYIDEMCEQLFKEAIVLHYGDNHLEIPPASNQRHPTGASRCCLCQLLDNKRTDLDISERLKAQTLDNESDDEETCLMKVVET